MKAIQFLPELSTDLLSRYKKAAYTDAKKADAEGDFERGNKRFRGINKATIKQFDNDLKNHDQLAEKSTTEKQARFMAAAAHDPQFAARVGIKQSVAKEFNKADTGTKQLSNAMKNKPKKKQQAAAEGWEEITEWLAEEGKASRALCQGGKPDSQLGASQLASCKSQGLRARDGEKSHLIGKGGSKVRVTVGGKKIKGKKYGGPLPDYGTRKGQL